MKKLIVRVVTMHGIKELPSKEMMALCYESWESKFSKLMKKQEMVLAFEMNVNGDFTIKSGGEFINRVNHFQCFSREFFCEVLNQYLKERVQANIRIAEEYRKDEEQKRLPPPDPTPQIFEAIVADYKKYHTEQFDLFSLDKIFDTHLRFPTAVKLEYLHEIFDVTIDEENIIKLRDHSKLIVIRDLLKKKTRYDKRTMFGVVMAIDNQVARLKAGKLLNLEDEVAIQAQVNRLLYLQVLANYKPESLTEIDKTEFVQHVKENIELYHQNQEQPNE